MVFPTDEVRVNDITELYDFLGGNNHMWERDFVFKERMKD
jgi:hypothetical protein